MRAREMMLVAMLGLSGCATTMGSGSFVSVPSSVKDQEIAANLTGLVAHVLPPAQTTVLLQPASGAAGKEFGKAIDAALRSRGFGVSAQSGVKVRYAVSMFDQSILLRVWTKNEVLSRAYQPDNAGKLVPVSPMTVGKSE